MKELGQAPPLAVCLAPQTLRDKESLAPLFPPPSVVLFLWNAAFQPFRFLPFFCFSAVAGALPPSHNSAPHVWFAASTSFSVSTPLLSVKIPERPNVPAAVFFPLVRGRLFFLFLNIGLERRSAQTSSPIGYAGLHQSSPPFPRKAERYPPLSFQIDFSAGFAFSLLDRLRQLRFYRFCYLPRNLLLFTRVRQGFSLLILKVDDCMKVFSKTSPRRTNHLFPDFFSPDLAL